MTGCAWSKVTGSGAPWDDFAQSCTGQARVDCLEQELPNWRPLAKLVGTRRAGLACWRRMVTLLIIGVVVVGVIGVLIVSLSAKRDVQMVDFAPPKTAPPQSVEALVRAGQKLEAIKLVRANTGVGLKEAKDAVDAMERGEPLPNVSAPGATVEELIRSGKTIEAIKRHRELTGLGLKEAKDAVEAMARGEPPGPPAMPRRITSEMAIDDSELRGHMSSGRVIDAIKRYRELTGLGLKEAKDAVEALRQTYKS